MEVLGEISNSTTAQETPTNTVTEQDGHQETTVYCGILDFVLWDLGLAVFIGMTKTITILILKVEYYRVAPTIETQGYIIAAETIVHTDTEYISRRPIHFTC